MQAPLLAKATQPPGLTFVDTALAADRSRTLQGAGRSARCPGGTIHSPRWPEGTEEAVRTPSRIGKSIHFPQVADLRWRHYNRGHEVAESCRKVVYRRHITVFNLAEKHDKDRLSSEK